MHKAVLVWADYDGEIVERFTDSGQADVRFKQIQKLERRAFYGTKVIAFVVGTEPKGEFVK